MFLRWGSSAIGAALLLASFGTAQAQVNDPNSGIQYRRGQEVVPAFEGWQPNTDGTFSFWFGYLNRNYEEEVNVPVGPNNSFSPGDPDRGQPAHFLVRRRMFVFKIIVPKDFPKDQQLVWTLTSHGKTLKAKGSLNPNWEVNNGVISENAGSGTYDPANEAPSITGATSASVALPGVLTLTASANDDGLPKPKVRKSRSAEAPKPDELTGIPSIIPENMTRGTGLNIRWVLFRGPGQVSFDPVKERPINGTAMTSTTKVTFSEPGDYWIRAIASDGMLESFHDVKVTVTK